MKGNDSASLKKLFKVAIKAASPAPDGWVESQTADVPSSIRDEYGTGLRHAA